VHTTLRMGGSPLRWVLAKGKAPPAFPTSEKLLLNVEGLNDATCLFRARHGRQGTPLANFFSILLEIPTAFDRLEQRHFVGILDIHPDWNPISDTRDPGPERFQLIR
jgi:hypothetical protein